MSQEAMTDASGKKLEKKEANLPSELTAMFEADAGMGMENVGSEDVKIPFLRILQDLSPQVLLEEVVHLVLGMVYIFLEDIL